MTDDCILIREMPAILVIADDSARRTKLQSALESAGWRVACTPIGHEAWRIAATEPISMVLVDFDHDARTSDLPSSIRAIQGATAAAPILALGSASMLEDSPYRSGIDAVLTDDEPESVVESLEGWRPVSLAPTRRIAEMFGAGPIAGMIERLARRLEAAMNGLESGSFDKAEAHRLAGLCGTLGFGQAHAAWLDMSLGDDSAIDEVRRTTRLTLSAIARGL